MKILALRGHMESLAEFSHSLGRLGTYRAGRRYQKGCVRRDEVEWYRIDKIAGSLPAVYISLLVYQGSARRTCTALAY